MSKLGNSLAVAVFLGISWWGLTYVPVVQDMLPNIITLAEPTVTLAMSDQDMAAGKLDPDRFYDACHDIPFLLRPIANRPESVKVVLNYQLRDIGEAVYNCRDGHLISSREY